MRTKIFLVISFLIYCTSLLFSQDRNDKISYNITPIDYRKHIYLKGTINDAEGHFVFDTGADILYLDSLFYNKSNFKFDSIAYSKLPGVGPVPQKVKVIVNSVRFDSGDLTYQTKFVPVVSLKTILGDFADGIIGLDFFSNKILEINYIQNYLKIHDNMDSLQLHQYSRIQCQKVKDRLYIPVTLSINNTVSIKDKFLIDLGCGSTIVLNSPVASKFNLDNVITNKTRCYNKYRGIGGESESYAFIAKSIEIGGYTLKRMVPIGP